MTSSDYLRSAQDEMKADVFANVVGIQCQVVAVLSKFSRATTSGSVIKCSSFPAVSTEISGNGRALALTAATITVIIARF